MTWLLLGLSVAACGGAPPDSASCPIEDVPLVEHEGFPEWENDEVEVLLVREREIELESGEKGFILNLRDVNVIYEDGRFLIADKLRGAGITVFDSTGSVVKSLRPVFESPTLGLVLTEEGLWVKSDWESTVARIDSTGEETARIETARGLNERQPVIIVGGFEVEGRGSRARVYTSIYEDRGLDTYGKGPRVGVFDSEGEVVRTFACLDPLYRELYLPGYNFQDFAIVRGRLYLVDAALPRIRVYTLDGEALRTLAGAGGEHFRQVERSVPQGATHARIDSLSVGLSYVYAVEEIRVSGHPDPVVGLAYWNRSEAWLDANPRNDNHTRHYLALYSLDGMLLARELPLPGRLLHANSAGQLVLNLDDRADRRRLGIYGIVVANDSQETTIPAQAR